MLAVDHEHATGRRSRRSRGWWSGRRRSRRTRRRSSTTPSCARCSRRSVRSAPDEIGYQKCEPVSGSRVGQGADLAAVEGPDVLLDQRVGRAQHDRVDRAHVHHVTHRGRGAAVARDRLARHREGDVVLAEAAVLGRGRSAPRKPCSPSSSRLRARELRARRRRSWRWRASPSRTARSAGRGARAGGRSAPTPGPTRNPVPRRARHPMSSRPSRTLHSRSAQICPIQFYLRG